MEDSLKEEARMWLSMIKFAIYKYLQNKYNFLLNRFSMSIFIRVWFVIGWFTMVFAVIQNKQLQINLKAI